MRTELRCVTHNSDPHFWPGTGMCQIYAEVQPSGTGECVWEDVYIIPKDRVRGHITLLGATDEGMLFPPKVLGGEFTGFTWEHNVPVRVMIVEVNDV